MRTIAQTVVAASGNDLTPPVDPKNAWTVASVRQGSWSMSGNTSQTLSWFVSVFGTTGLPGVTVGDRAYMAVVCNDSVDGSLADSVVVSDQGATALYDPAWERILSVPFTQSASPDLGRLMVFERDVIDYTEDLVPTVTGTGNVYASASLVVVRAPFVSGVNAASILTRNNVTSVTDDYSSPTAALSAGTGGDTTTVTARGLYLEFMVPPFDEKDVYANTPTLAVGQSQIFVNEIDPKSGAWGLIAGAIKGVDYNAGATVKAGFTIETFPSSAANSTPGIFAGFLLTPKA